MPKWKHGTAKNQWEAGMRRSAESRRCPKCQRKSALVRLPRTDEFLAMTYCRWNDCDYERHHPLTITVLR